MTKAKQPFSGITPVYDRLLRGCDDMPVGLYHLRIATPAQLCRLHYSQKSVKFVEGKLRLLAEHGYVQSDCQPTKLYRSPYYYALDKEGVAYLRALDYEISESFRSVKAVDKHSIFVQHTLELNEVLSSALLLKRVQPLCYLHDFRHEWQLQRHPYELTWRSKKIKI